MEERATGLADPEEGTFFEGGGGSVSKDHQ